MLTSIVLFLLLRCYDSIDTITQNQPIKDGEILVSDNESFALGFCSPGNSSNRYVCIWYNKVPEQTVVWIANRDNPITDFTGFLSIDNTGNLVLRYRNVDLPVWSTNISAMETTTTNVTYSAQLLDSGNLVLLNSTRVLAWQSFDYPTDTLLPDMKLGLDRRTGLNRFLTSWKSRDDPGTGDCTLKMDVNGSPQLFLSQRSVRVWRTGPWIGHRWSGVPEMTNSSILITSYVDNHNEVTVMSALINASILTRLVIDESGFAGRFLWLERRWVYIWSTPVDKCAIYGRCGVNGLCDTYGSYPFECTCLPGFEPNSASDWYLRNASKWCISKRGKVCGDGEGFMKVERSRVPDTSTARVEKSMNLTECEEMCLGDCSCTGYASADVNGSGIGCITWYGDLVDTRLFPNAGQDLYIRVDALELAQYSRKPKSSHRKRLVTIVVVALTAMLLVLPLAYWLVMKKRKGLRGTHKLLTGFSTGSPPFYEGTWNKKEINGSGTNSDVTFFDLNTIVAATNNFSPANRLGEGGFGTVYKGQLCNGEEIAVKRLSKTSRQGTVEFKNEVTLIAKLQHRNLVRLLGCCIQQQEKMLIYEYLPNKGLDSFIFDKAQRSMLIWRKRFEIILGIARGMLYLHQDSRLRIIHRDLKASNVLLDATMNPKISDFGMAKIFDGDQIEANTNRVVGTFGYMSPEYAMEGLFSTKSDVFSFGILLLEIISGRKNTSYHHENTINLIGQVWKLWKENRALDIVDSSLAESYQADEILRCINIGLLCVQEFAGDRPTMSVVLSMLRNETALPSPNQPAFIFKKANNVPGTATTSEGTTSVNEITLSMVDAR